MRTLLRAWAALTFLAAAAGLGLVAAGFPAAGNAVCGAACLSLLAGWAAVRLSKL